MLSRVAENRIPLGSKARRASEEEVKTAEGEITGKL
jgi:hypothetical protein